MGLQSVTGCRYVDVPQKDRSYAASKQRLPATFTTVRNLVFHCGPHKKARYRSANYGELCLVFLYQIEWWRSVDKQKSTTQPRELKWQWELMAVGQGSRMENTLRKTQDQMYHYDNEHKQCRHFKQYNQLFLWF